MFTCKDCVHYDVCNRVEKQIVFTDSSFEEVINSLIKCCRHFKNKADFVEVKHGEWRNVYMSSPSSFVGTCSECKRSSDIPPPEQARYCPKCGAGMRKEGADNS